MGHKMLKTIKKSANKKLGGIAATYRSGVDSVYGSCPKTCPLMPIKERDTGAVEIDQEYLQAVLDAVPEGGVSWTYTHFSPEDLPRPEWGKTCINISTDGLGNAYLSYRSGNPTVVVIPEDDPQVSQKVIRLQTGENSAIRVVRCPAEYSPKITCSNCGGDEPLCARQSRDFIIRFTAHGSSKKKVATGDGGCYGSSGPVALQWRKTMDNTRGQSLSDATLLRDWVKTLPYGTFLRHHVVGDLG